MSCWVCACAALPESPSSRRCLPGCPAAARLCRVSWAVVRHAAGLAAHLHPPRVAPRRGTSATSCWVCACAACLQAHRRPCVCYPTVVHVDERLGSARLLVWVSPSATRPPRSRRRPRCSHLRRCEHVDNAPRRCPLRLSPAPAQNSPPGWLLFTCGCTLQLCHVWEHGFGIEELWHAVPVRCVWRHVALSLCDLGSRSW